MYLLRLGECGGMILRTFCYLYALCIPERLDIICMLITLVKNENVVDVHKEKVDKESVENPIYAGRGNKV